ncbi:MAG: cyclodeaminase/cyclohydrolase family protein [Dehalobacterium sp.]
MKLTCGDFVDEVSSDSPAPGGGSVSALAGSLGAALVGMVANLTLKKEQCDKTNKEIDSILVKSLELKEQLKAYVDEDTAAFNKVMAAFKIPQGTPEEKKDRADAVQSAFRGATNLPLQVAGCCLDVLKLAQKVVQIGNPNALSDTGVAVLMAYAGIHGAILNVEINIGSIKDNELVNEIKEKKESITSQAEMIKSDVLMMIKNKIC